MKYLAAIYAVAAIVPGILLIIECLGILFYTPGAEYDTLIMSNGLLSGILGIGLILSGQLALRAMKKPPAKSTEG